MSIISGGESSRGEGRGSVVGRPPSLFGIIFDKKRHQNIYQKIGVPKSAPGGAQGRPGEPQGEPRGPNGSQKAPKRLPKELPKSIILGFGQETSEIVKIALPCRRELNFQGSGAFEIELFL